MSGDQLVRMVANVAAEAVRLIEPPRLAPTMTYAEAGDALHVSADTVRTLVDRGVLVRPEWARTEVRAAVVTTVSVYEACGWPVTPLEVAVPAATIAEQGVAA